MGTDIRSSLLVVLLAGIAGWGFLLPARVGQAQDDVLGPDVSLEDADTTPRQIDEATYAGDASWELASHATGEACHSCRGCPGCEKQKAFAKKAGQAYQELFYNNNFDYLDDPAYTGWHLGENLKRIRLCDGWIVDVGGQYRLREHSERNIRNDPAVPFRLGLTGNSDDFLLHRTRLYVNSEFGERIRFYGEMLDARSELEDVLPRGIEENRTDIQNLFLDVAVVDNAAGRLVARAGRQEVALGSQRLVSPLDWANTRRTFEGGRLMWQGEKWDVDGLWVRPERRFFDRLDPPDQNRDLYGIYTTYKGMARDKIDVYWLAIDYSDVGAHFDTLAARYYGNLDAWLYELEGGVQVGQNPDDSDHSAGFFTLGLGRKFEKVWAKPTLWSYYDWASGDNTVNNGFHHYEPLAHKYLGLMDLYGRRNIETVNLLLTMQPHEKLTLLAWYYYFWLQDINDVPYNVDMTPFANLPAGSASSRDLGHEIDLTATYIFSPRMNVLFGYSHFFSGEFYKTTPGVPYRGDADFFYTQLTVNF